MNSKTTCEESEQLPLTENNQPMKALFASDIDLVVKKTKLSQDAARLLLELESDVDLVLDALSPSLTFEEIKTLSAPLYLKACVFKYSKNTAFDIKEKAYIAATLLAYLPNILGVNPRSIVSAKEQTEETSRYQLVAFCVKQTKNLSLRNIDAGFRTNGQRDIANHLDGWVEVISKLNTDGWFSESGVIKVNEKPATKSRRRIPVD